MERKTVKSIVLGAALTGAMIVFSVMEIARHIDSLRKLIDDNSLPEVDAVDAIETKDESAESVDG